MRILKTIAVNHGYRLLAVRAHDADHLHVFVSAPPKIAISEMVRVLKCVSAQLLLEEFPAKKRQLWSGHLWSEGYAVRTAGDVTCPKNRRVHQQE